MAEEDWIPFWRGLIAEKHNRRFKPATLAKHRADIQDEVEARLTVIRREQCFGVARRSVKNHEARRARLLPPAR